MRATTRDRRLRTGENSGFNNGWSGGLNFLQYRDSGSEVAVEPNDYVYPCCLKTQLPIGNLLAEKLEAMLERLIGNPVYEAITMGHPKRMGLAHGWSVDKFLAKSTITLPSRRVYRNLCIGCDAFHREVLKGQQTESAFSASLAPPDARHQAEPPRAPQEPSGQQLGGSASGEVGHDRAGPHASVDGEQRSVDP